MTVEEHARRAVCRLLAGRPLDPAMLSDDVATMTADILGRSCWQVLPVIAARFPQEWRSQSELGRLFTASAALEKYGRLHTSLTLELTDRFDRASIPYVLLKSSAARYCVYDRPELRVGWDVDLAVPTGHLAGAESIAREMCFQPAEFDTTNMRFVPGVEERRDALLTTHYELAFLVYRAALGHQINSEERNSVAKLPIAPAFMEDGESTICDVALDIHHGLSLDIGTDVVFDGLQQAQVDGKTVFVPNPGALAFHMIFKLYWEGVHTYAKGLYQFADLIALIPSLADEDCERLLGLLEKNRLEIGGMFVLRRLPRNFGAALPPRLSDWVTKIALRSHSGEVAHQNDLGDVWPRLWGRASLDFGAREVAPEADC